MKKFFMRSAPPLGIVLIIVALVATLQFPATYLVLKVSPVLGIVVNQVVVILILPLAIIVLAGFSPIPLIGMKLPGSMQMLTAICVTLGCAIILAYAKAGSDFIIPVPKILLANQSRLVAVHSWHDFFLKLAMLGVLAPFCEEILFRGVLQSSLSRRIGAWQSIVTTAILFALIHSASFQPHLLLILGLLLSWLYYATGSIRVTIICHAISNYWVLANQLRGMHIPLTHPPGTPDLFLGGSAAVIVVAGITWLYCRRRRTS